MNALELLLSAPTGSCEPLAALCEPHICTDIHHAEDIHTFGQPLQLHMLVNPATPSGISAQRWHVSFPLACTLPYSCPSHSTANSTFAALLTAECTPFQSGLLFSSQTFSRIVPIDTNHGVPVLHW